MEKRNRFLLLAAAIVVIFVATVAVLLRRPGLRHRDGIMTPHITKEVQQ